MCCSLLWIKEGEKENVWHFNDSPESSCGTFIVGRKVVHMCIISERPCEDVNVGNGRSIRSCVEGHEEYSKGEFSSYWSEIDNWITFLKETTPAPPYSGNRLISNLPWQFQYRLHLITVNNSRIFLLYTRAQSLAEEWLKDATRPIGCQFQLNLIESI